jgi:TldD protein
VTSSTTHPIDETFLALPLADLAGAALARAADQGCSHADVRIERIRESFRSYRDADLSTSQDSEVLGLSVRVLHEGVWGFAAGVTLTTDAAARLADRALATALVSRPLTPVRIELADEPVYPDASWVSAYEQNPFDVPEADRHDRMRELIDRLLAADAVSHTAAELSFVQENKYFANLAGTTTTQQRVRILPQFSATHVDDDGFSTMRTLAAPAGRGWEYLNGSGWDFDAEIAELPELLAAHVSAPSVEAGRYDLLVDPTNLWLTIHESIAHATELDRALGYEAAYAGTSFATVDRLGKLQYGSDGMIVTGDRTTEHGLSTVGWDDEGVAAQEFEIISGGILVGYQLDRQMAALRGLERSNGCAFADSPGHIPLQRMPNVSLRPDPNGPSIEELISSVKRGIYVLGDNSWSIDMQRYNFQFTGQRFHLIEDGRLAGQLRDVAYQATTTDFWNSLVAVGGPETYHLGGAFNCGKGQPGQVAPVSHGAPAALFRGVNILNTLTEGVD